MKIIIFNAVVVSILSLAPTAWSQTFGQGQATSPTFQVVDNSIGGNTTYNCSATVNVQMDPYITQNGHYYFTATLAAQCSLVSGPAPGVGVIIFGQNASLTHSSSIDNVNTVPFGGSTITLGSYPNDFWDDSVGSYQATYQDYNVDAGGPDVQLGFSVGWTPISLSITPINSDHTITLSGPPSGANGHILMTNTLSVPLGHTRFSGVFQNGDLVTLNNIQLNDSSATGGGEIGYVTLFIPLTGAHTYYSYLPATPIVDSFTPGPTMALQVPYVRDQGIPMPTVSVTQSANQVQIGQTVTLNVQLINNSQAVPLGNASQNVQVSIDTSSFNNWFHLASGQTNQSVASIPVNGSHTFSFQLVADAPTPAGGITPQFYVDTGWGSPATTKQNYNPSTPFQANQPIIVLVPVTMQTSPSGLSFSVDGTPYTIAQTFSWVPGSFHTISTTQTQSGGTGIQYVYNNWSDNLPISHTVSPTSSTTYTANFNKEYYLTMNAGAGGSVGQNSQWLNSGQSFSINASPDSCHNFSSWTGSGTGSYSGASISASVTMNGPITETANFTTKQYTVTPSSGGNGTISPNTAQTVNCGGSIGFTANPANGYIVGQWLVNGTPVQNGGTSFTLNNVSADTSVEVTFTVTNPVTYTVTPSNGANGAISPNTPQTVNSGASIGFTATPTNGYVVSQWLANGTSVQNGGNTFTLTNVLANTSVQVTFTLAAIPQLFVSPSSGFSSSGFQGGSYTPSSIQYSVSNSAAGTLNWTNSADENWVTVSPTTGQNAGPVTVSINANANALVPNTYYSTLTFGGNGGSTNFQVVLTILSSGQFALSPACVNGLQVDINGGTYFPRPGGQVTNILWNWGDGQQAPGYFPNSHIYSSAGNYTVQVTSQYSDGSSATLSQTNYVAPGILSNCVTCAISANQYGTVSYQASVGSGTVSAGTSITLQLDYADDVFLTANPSNNDLLLNWASSSGIWFNYGSSNTPSVGAVIDGNSTIIANFCPLSLGIGSQPWGSNGFNFSVYAPAGSNVVIQVSTNLVNWKSIYTNSGSFMFTDTNATNYSQRFYRLMEQ